MWIGPNRDRAAATDFFRDVLYELLAGQPILNHPSANLHRGEIGRGRAKRQLPTHHSRRTTATRSVPLAPTRTLRGALPDAAPAQHVVGHTAGDRKHRVDDGAELSGRFHSPSDPIRFDAKCIVDVA